MQQKLLPQTSNSPLAAKALFQNCLAKRSGAQSLLSPPLETAALGPCKRSVCLPWFRALFSAGGIVFLLFTLPWRPLSSVHCVCRGKCYDPKQLGHKQYSANYGISALLDHCLSAPDLSQVVSGMLKLVNASALKLDACLMQLLKSHMFKEALFVLSLISRIHLTLRVAI